MKKHVKSLLVSSMLAVGFGGLTVGTTFALFTDKAETKVRVQAGIVDVNQTLSIVSVKELNDVTVSPDLEGVYTNSIGGKTYVDTQNPSILHLEKWVPGDKAVIRITTNNDSNVNIKTRFKFDVTQLDNTKPNLDDVLNVSYSVTGGTNSPIDSSNYLSWTLVEPNVDDLSVIDVTIEFPDSDNGALNFDSSDNAYQDGNVSYIFTQQAVQGNAVVQDYGNVYTETIGTETYEVKEFNNVAGFEQMMEDLGDVDVSDAEELAEAQKTIYRLSSNLDLSGAVDEDYEDNLFIGTLDGNGNMIKNAVFDAGSYSSTAGMFSKYYDGSTVKNLRVDHCEISGGENVGLLFGQSYNHAMSQTTSDYIDGTKLNIENVEIGEDCIVSGIKGVGAIAGSIRYIDTINMTNVVNRANVLSTSYNVGGFFGTASSAKTFNATNCVNYGEVRGTTQVAGFVGHSDALTTVNIQNCANYGDIVAFASHNGKTNVGYFIGQGKSGRNNTYVNNYNEGTIKHVELSGVSYVNYEDQFIGNGISLPAGKTAEDVNIIDNSIALNYTIDGDNNFVVEPVAGAAYYTVTMQIYSCDVTLSGNTATVQKEHHYGYMRKYDTVQEIKENFGHITRAGYVLDSIYTEYAYNPDTTSKNSTMNGRANFFRLPYATKDSYTLNAPHFDENLNEWVFVFDAEHNCPPGTGKILSPKNTSVTYIITAYDANNKNLATAYRQDLPKDRGTGFDESGSYLKNMDGYDFKNHSSTEVYAPVA